MNEAELKSRLMEYLRRSFPGYVIFRHEDKITSGIPDISVTGSELTTWMEVKYANPKFASKGIQELTMLRLSLASSAFYVVYYEKNKERRTYIVEPQDIGRSIDLWTNSTEGFDHSWVVAFIKERHNDYQQQRHIRGSTSDSRE